MRCAPAADPTIFIDDLIADDIIYDLIRLLCDHCAMRAHVMRELYNKASKILWEGLRFLTRFLWGSGKGTLNCPAVGVVSSTDATFVLNLDRANLSIAAYFLKTTTTTHRGQVIFDTTVRCFLICILGPPGEKCVREASGKMWMVIVPEGRFDLFGINMCSLQLIKCWLLELYQVLAQMSHMKLHFWCLLMFCWCSVFAFASDMIKWGTGPGEMILGLYL